MIRKLKASCNASELASMRIDLFEIRVKIAISLTTIQVTDTVKLHYLVSRIVQKAFNS